MMNINQWGPAGWHFMHAVAFAYPEHPTDEDKENACKFFESVPYVLPCQRCREHFKVCVKNDPPSGHVDSMDSLSRWVVDLHNAVNANIGRPPRSYDEMYMEYMGPLVASGLAPMSPTVNPNPYTNHYGSPYNSPARAVHRSPGPPAGGYPVMAPLSPARPAAPVAAALNSTDSLHSTHSKESMQSKDAKDAEDAQDAQDAQDAKDAKVDDAKVEQVATAGKTAETAAQAAADPAGSPVRSVAPVNIAAVPMLGSAHYYQPQAAASFGAGPYFTRSGGPTHVRSVSRERSSSRPGSMPSSQSGQATYTRTYRTGSFTSRGDPSPAYASGGYPPNGYALPPDPSVTYQSIGGGGGVGGGGQGYYYPHASSSSSSSTSAPTVSYEQHGHGHGHRQGRSPSPVMMYAGHRSRSAYPGASYGSHASSTSTSSSLSSLTSSFYGAGSAHGNGSRTYR